MRQYHNNNRGFGFRYNPTQSSYVPAPTDAFKEAALHQQKKYDAALDQSDLLYSALDEVDSMGIDDQASEKMKSDIIAKLEGYSQAGNYADLDRSLKQDARKFKRNVDVLTARQKYLATQTAALDDVEGMDGLTKSSYSRYWSNQLQSQGATYDEKTGKIVGDKTLSLLNPTEVVNMFEVTDKANKGFEARYTQNTNGKWGTVKADGTFEEVSAGRVMSNSMTSINADNKLVASLTRAAQLEYAQAGESEVATGLEEFDVEYSSSNNGMTSLAKGQLDGLTTQEYLEKQFKEHENSTGVALTDAQKLNAKRNLLQGLTVQDEKLNMSRAMANKYSYKKLTKGDSYSSNSKNKNTPTVSFYETPLNNSETVFDDVNGIVDEQRLTIAKLEAVKENNNNELDQAQANQLEQAKKKLAYARNYQRLYNNKFVKTPKGISATNDAWETLNYRLHSYGSVQQDVKDVFAKAFPDKKAFSYYLETGEYVDGLNLTDKEEELLNTTSTTRWSRDGVASTARGRAVLGGMREDYGEALNEYIKESDFSVKGTAYSGMEGSLNDYSELMVEDLVNGGAGGGYTLYGGSEDGSLNTVQNYMMEKGISLDTHNITVKPLSSEGQFNHGKSIITFTSKTGNGQNAKAAETATFTIEPANGDHALTTRAISKMMEERLNTTQIAGNNFGITKDEFLDNGGDSNDWQAFSRGQLYLANEQYGEIFNDVQRLVQQTELGDTPIAVGDKIMYPVLDDKGNETLDGNGEVITQPIQLHVKEFIDRSTKSKDEQYTIKDHKYSLVYYDQNNQMHYVDGGKGQSSIDDLKVNLYRATN
jgi:hypothetical protein